MSGRIRIDLDRAFPDMTSVGGYHYVEKENGYWSKMVGWEARKVCSDRIRARSRRSHEGDLWIEAPAFRLYREDGVNEGSRPVHNALLHCKDGELAECWYQRGAGDKEGE